AKWCVNDTMPVLLGERRISVGEMGWKIRVG
ncbi:hypothetical protein ABIB50_005442, partial [Mucilaginibacter sp. UYCu711]